MTGSRGRRLLVAGSAVVIASMAGASAQEQREVQPEVVRPEVGEEGPPFIVKEAEEPQEHNPEQLLTSLRRAEEALQNDDRKAAMQELIQAREQLSQTANARLDAEPWQRIDLAIQDAMKALAEDNPRYAQIALQRVTAPEQGGDAGNGPEGGQGAPQHASLLESMPADDVIGAEVVDDRGETIAEVKDIVRDPERGDLYAILDVGGFLGIADKEVALALDRLQVAQDEKLVLPGVTESQLKEMSVFEEKDFEELR